MKDSSASGFSLGEIKEAIPILPSKAHRRGPVFWGLVLFFILAASVALYLFLADRLTGAQGQEQLTKYGYAGIFAGTFISSASIVLPLPGPMLTFVGGALLNPLFVGLVVGVAEPLGELTGYAAGVAGRRIIERNRFLVRLEHWMLHHGTITVFAVSLIPNPFVDFIGITAGAARFPLWKFLGAAWVGKTIKSLAVAYAGAWGVERLLNLFGLLHK